MKRRAAGAVQGSGEAIEPLRAQLRRIRGHPGLYPQCEGLEPSDPGPGKPDEAGSDE